MAVLYTTTVAVLKFYLSLGMVVTSADYFVEYEVAPIFKEHIETLARKKERAQLKGNAIKAAMYKLLVSGWWWWWWSCVLLLYRLTPSTAVC